MANAKHYNYRSLQKYGQSGSKNTLSVGGTKIHSISNQEKDKEKDKEKDNSDISNHFPKPKREQMRLLKLHKNREKRLKHAYGQVASQK